MRTWWKKKSGTAKTVTALAVLLVLEIGLCFASTADPAWFDALFHIRPNPEGLRLGMVTMEAYACLFTFVLLVIALLVWAAGSWSSVDDAVSVVLRGSDGMDEERSDEETPRH